MPEDIPSEKFERTDRQMQWIGVVGLVVLFGYYLVYVFGRLRVKHYGDFPTFYWAAYHMRVGGDPFLPYEQKLAYVYPPLLAVLYMPLTWISKVHAEQLMLPLHVAMVVASVLLGVRAIMQRMDIPMRPGRWLLSCFIAVALSENELRNQLQAMETDVLMLFCFTLAFVWLDRRPILAGGVLGFAMNIKYLSIVALPYLILRRRWAAAAALLGATVLFALLPALAIGWDRNLEYLQAALGGLMRWFGRSPAASGHVLQVHEIWDGVSVSITSACSRIFDERRHPSPVPRLVAAGIGLLALAVAAGIYALNQLPFLRWPAARGQSAQPYRGLVAIEWPCLIGLMLAFSPNTNARHLVMALLLNMAAAVILLNPRAGVWRWPLLIAALLMFFGFIMPLQQFFGEQFSRVYFFYGMQTWGLMVMILTLAAVGARYIRMGGGAP